MAQGHSSKMAQDYPKAAHSPRLTGWMKKFKLDTYASQFAEAGLDSIEMLTDMEPDEIDEFLVDIQMPKLKLNRFKKAVAAVQSGKYEIKQPDEKDDEKKMSPADQELMELRTKRKDQKGIVHLPLNKSKGSSSKYKMFYTDVDPVTAHDGKTTRTVMFIGQTGAGKTTLIQSMTNYLMRVGYDEPFRYELINEGADKDVHTKDVTVSQTVAITQYHMHNMPRKPGIPDSAITVVDSPGFGDTRGPDQDLKIRGLFKNFFEKVPMIDAIYFVVKASDTRIGAAQKYLFQMVMDLFGKNVKDNIFILFTFSDGAKPPALTAVRKLQIPFAGWFQINNSGFGLPDEDTPRKTHEGFFDMGNEMFANIFKALSKVKPVSTNQSAETLKERDNINNTLSRIGRANKDCLDKVDTATKFYSELKKHASKIDQNEDFEFEEEYIERVKTNCRPGQHTTYCPTCQMTCHEWCAFDDGPEKRGCCAFDSRGFCTECHRKCEWSVHKNESFYYAAVKKKRMTTRADVLARFNMAKDAAANSETLIQAQLEEIAKIERTIEDNIKKMKASVDQLKRIALNDQVLTDDDYFDTLIHSEEAEAKPGWRARKKQLEALKEHNRMLRDVVANKTTAASIAKNEELKDIKSKMQAKKKKGGWSLKFW